MEFTEAESNVLDIIAEYQQYQEATIDDDYNDYYDGDYESYSDNDGYSSELNAEWIYIYLNQLVHFPLYHNHLCIILFFQLNGLFE